MEYLSLEHVSKSYGEKVLLSDIQLNISKGDKIALIAKNGSGKSTLLRIIAGSEAAEGDHSRVLLSKNIKVGFLDQNPDFASGVTIQEAFLNIDLPEVQAVKQYQQAMESNNPAELESAVTLMDDLKAWDVEARGHELLYRFKLEDLDTPVSILSGGQKKRLALAQLIMSEPDFLILDEPTNHLDVEMIEWLESYLSTAAMTLFMVTHDRYFLERICNEIIELDKGLLFKYRGNYSDYLEKKELRHQTEGVVLDKTKKLLRKELEWMRRQPKARGTKAKSRQDGYYKLEDEVSSISYDDVFEIEVDSMRLGKKILEFYDASKSFDEKAMLKEFWYKFRNGERVGVSGPNGSGKTTFVKLLTGELRLDTGNRVAGDTVQFGYYSQDGLVLDEDKRVIDVVKEVGDYIPLKKGHKLSAAALLERFLFSREHQQVYVSQLSGGERKRLHLLRVLMKNPNFLILDEPTNDIDILTLNVLENYLMQFKGCLVIISHDRFFMDKLVEHMFIFEGEGVIHDFNGTYSQWKSQAKSNKKNVAKKNTQIAAESKQMPESDPTIRKISYLEKKELETLEKDIKKLESRKTEIEAAFMDVNLGTDQITTLSKKLGEVEQSIDAKETRWLELSDL